MLRFKPGVTQEHRDTFVREFKMCKNLPGVRGGRAIMSGPSLTDPVALSKGFEYAFVSYHDNLAALKEYQSCEDHNR
jgi:hypothetical protein